MMNSIDFDEIQAQIQAHYQAGDYAAAYDLSTRYINDFPKQRPLLSYWRISMAACLGKTAQAIKLYEETLKNGTWYGEVLLRKSPSLKTLQGVPEFEQLVVRNQELRRQDQSQTIPLIILRPSGECGQGDLPCSTLLALHGNASTAQASLEFWKPVAKAGWLVGIPQSTQAIWKDAYVWDDLDISQREILTHYASLASQYAVDPEQSVIAGYAMGAEVAAYLAVTAAVPVIGFLAVTPSGPFTNAPEKWRPYIQAAQQRLENDLGYLRGYILVDKNERNISLESIEYLVDMLSQAGIACDMEKISGDGHKYPERYASAILRGLDYILEME